MSDGNGMVTFDTLDDAAAAYSELRGEYAHVREQLAEQAKQTQALFDICRDNGRALDLLLKEYGLSLPVKEDDDGGPGHG